MSRLTGYIADIGPNSPTKKVLPLFPHPLPPCDTRPTFRPNGWPEHTELWLAGGGEFRFAGAVPAGRELAKPVPGQRGGLSHRGGWGEGNSREWPEPVAPYPGAAGGVRSAWL